MDPITISAKEAVRISGLSRVTLWRLTATEKLDAVKVGGKLLIKMESLRALLENGCDEVPVDPLRQSRAS